MANASEMVYHSYYHQTVPAKGVLCPMCKHGLEFIGMGGWYCTWCEAPVLSPSISEPEGGPCPYPHLHVG